MRGCHSSLRSRRLGFLDWLYRFLLSDPWLSLQQEAPYRMVSDHTDGTTAASLSMPTHRASYSCCAPSF